MMIQLPFHELHTSEVLPMPHGLLEERLVSSAEIAVDLVWNDSVLPDSLLAVCGSSDGSVAFSDLGMDIGFFN